MAADRTASSAAPDDGDRGRPVRAAWFFTRFPHPTETFLQREVRGLHALGHRPQLHSFHAGAPRFDDEPVLRFSKLRLLGLPWFVAIEWIRRPREVARLTALLFTTWPRDWLNHWENLYGAGAGAVLAGRLRRDGIRHVHAAWASLPAMAAWVIARLNGITFSTGAHAYDLFEHGGDWFLREKCAEAAFVHTSTHAGVRRLCALGVPEARILFVRRGLDRLPPPRPLRPQRRPLRVVCVARLVPKKGLLRQIGLYRAARDAGLDLEVRILGDGPLREALLREIRAAGLAGVVSLEGHVEQAGVWAALERADVLVHTGVVTRSGDRDGLPNVVPEAMAAGAIVVTAPGEGVLEAIEHEVTGLVCPLDRPEAWIAAFRRLRDDDALAGSLRSRARAWVEQEFDATRNAARLFARVRAAVAGEPGLAADGGGEVR